MSYPYVAAKYDYGPRKGPALGFLIHMAEGGGTVAFLAGNPARGVSVHYVIERTGRIVRMLDEDHASGSANPGELRTTDDPDGFYGVTAAKAVLKDWWHDPNSAVISVEVEGFAATGPNAAQHASLRTLVNDVRSRHPAIGLLGHRDLTSTKACPGRLIHWNDLGGHATEDIVGLHVTFPQGPLVTGSLAIPKGSDAIRVADGAHYSVPQPVDRPATKAALTGPNSGTGYLVDLNGDELHFIRATVGTFTAAQGGCEDAVAAEHERTRAQALAAVGGI